MLEIPVHGLRSADPRRLPRQVADQGDPLLPPDPEPRRSGSWNPPPPCRATSASRPSSSRCSRGRARASRTTPSSGRRSSSTSASREVVRLYDQPVIVERFIGGREFTVGVLGNVPDLEVLPIVEIDHSQLPPGATPIYSYEAKWIWDTPDKPLEIFHCPAGHPGGAPAPHRAPRDADDLASSAIRDWCRIDVRCDDAGVPNILEVNPLPGRPPEPGGQFLPAQGGPDRRLHLFRSHPPRGGRGLRTVRTEAGGRPSGRRGGFRSGRDEAMNGSRPTGRHRLQRLRTPARSIPANGSRRSPSPRWPTRSTRPSRRWATT